MIQHLNPVSFQGFGTILPEKGRSTDMSTQKTLRLDTDTVCVYLADKDLRLCCGYGTTVLCVSKNNVDFSVFYLDKPIEINAGVYFSLSAFNGTSSAVLSADQTPEMVGTLPVKPNYTMDGCLQVQRLYTFFYHEKEKGFLFPGESHPMLELTYVDQGSLHSVADGVDLLLEQGDIVLYAPDQWHMQFADMQVAPRYVTLSFDIADGDLSRLYNRKFKAPQKAVTMLQQMLREQERMDTYSGDMIISLLTQLLLTLLRETDLPAEKMQATHSLHSENAIIRRAQQYISTHVRDKLSVPIVAKNTDISPSYLTALFHKHLQISPGEYIRRIKLQESKQMIREDAMNFTEIAAALKYSTVHHFSRQFKEKFGITPSEYAKSVR